MAVKKINELNIHENPSTNEDAFDVENYLNANFETILDVVDNNADELTTTQTIVGGHTTSITNLQTATQTNTTNITALQQENERLKEDLKNSTLTISGTGESVTLNNTAKATLKDIGLSGNSKQNGTPTPASPIDIDSAGDSGNITEKIIGKNFWDKANIQWKKNNMSDFDLNTSDGSTTRIRTSTFKVIPGKTYILTGYPSSVSIVSVGSFDKNKTRLSGEITRDDNYFTLSSKVEYLYFLFGGSNFTSETNTMMANANIQLELTSSPVSTPYESYKQQSITIPCQQPMRAIGDVRDTFIKINGTWYERHYIGAVTFNGTEDDWTVYSSSSSRTVFSSPVIQDLYNLASGSVIPEILCDSFIPVSQSASWVSGNVAMRVSYKRFYFAYDPNITLNAWKEILAQQNINATYRLYTPVDLECTQAQVTAIENLLKAQSYEGQTNIYSEDEVSAIVDVKAYGDLNAILSQNNS